MKNDLLAIEKSDLIASKHTEKNLLAARTKIYVDRKR